MNILQDFGAKSKRSYQRVALEQRFNFLSNFCGIFTGENHYVVAIKKIVFQNLQIVQTKKQTDTRYTEYNLCL